MRLLVAALAAGAGLIAYMADRSRSHSRHPPQPWNQNTAGRDTAAHGHKPAADEQPGWPTQQSLDGGSEARERERDARDAKHQLAERRFWVFGLLVSVAATVATALAAGFAYGAYKEAHRQADIAQDALVTTTRARLKLTSISNVRTMTLNGLELSFLTVSATYKNFGLSPAQNIFLRLHISVAGTGGTPTETCNLAKSTAPGDYSAEIVFSQDDGGDGRVYAIPLLPDALEAQAAEARVAQPNVPIELTVVGCLMYRSTDSSTVYVTGTYGQLLLARADPEDVSAAYRAIIEGGGSVSGEFKFSARGAWAE